LIAQSPVSDDPGNRRGVGLDWQSSVAPVIRSRLVFLPWDEPAVAVGHGLDLLWPASGQCAFARDGHVAGRGTHTPVHDRPNAGSRQRGRRPRPIREHGEGGAAPDLPQIHDVFSTFSSYAESPTPLASPFASLGVWVGCIEPRTDHSRRTMSDWLTYNPVIVATSSINRISIWPIRRWSASALRRCNSR
jgi:hypothetical protein